MDTSRRLSSSSNYRRASTCSLRDSIDAMDADFDALRDSTALDDDNARDTWTFRSTIDMCSDDLGDLDDDGNQCWSDDDRSDNNASLSATDDDGDGSDDLVGRHYHHHHQQQQQQQQQQQWQSSNQDGDVVTVRSSSSSVRPFGIVSETRKAPPKLRSIPGFSNSEALKTRLPVRRAATAAATPTPMLFAPPVAGSAKTLKPHALSLKQQQQQHMRLDRVDRLALKKRAQQQLPPSLPCDDCAVYGPTLEHKIAMHDELTRRDAKVQRGAMPNSSQLLPRDVTAPATYTGTAYRMTARMVYTVAFTSAVALHCALFNFSRALRRLLQLDALPFGVFLLVCWAAVGVLSFVGGWLGDVVRDRVVLLRRAAALWALAALLLHVAAFRADSTLSSALLALALPAAGLAHGVLAPNCVVLGAQLFAPHNDRRCRTTRQRRRRGQRSLEVDTVSSSNSNGSPRMARKLRDGARDDAAHKFEHDRLAHKIEHERLASTHAALRTAVDRIEPMTDNEDNDSDNNDDVSSSNREQQLAAARAMAVHRYFSRCFGASLVGSAGVQLFFFLLVDDVDALVLPPTAASVVTRRGFVCMLFASALLLAALICFAFHSRHHVPSLPLPLLPHTADALERKLALESHHARSVDRGPFLWRAVLRVCSRAAVGYALLLSLLLVLAGVAVAVGALVGVRSAAFRVRLAAFLLIFVGWFAAVTISRLQLRASGTLAVTCRRLNVPLQQLEGSLLVVFFVGMASLAAFLRAQLYTTLVVQVCQTRLALPSATAALLNPNALGALASAVSLLLVPLAHAMTQRRRTSTPRTPARRLSLGICLYLVGVFLASVVELYRRTNASGAAPQPKCSKTHAPGFHVLWTAPHVVLLGVSDTVFRVSLLEQLHAIELLTARWPGFLHGAIAGAEAVGYVGALALTSALSEWLFRPRTSDLAVVLLLLTTLLAFSYAALKRIAEKLADRRPFDDDDDSDDARPSG